MVQRGQRRIGNLRGAAGGEVIEGPGSAVSFRHGESVEFFHRPHPHKQAKRYQIRAVRAFLTQIGVEP